MSGISDFRAQHPEYNDMSDQQLTDALYSKFYSDMPRAQFDAKMGIQQPPDKPFLRRAADTVNDFVRGAAAGADQVGYNIERGLESIGVPAHLLRAATGDTATTEQAHRESVANTTQNVSGEHPIAQGAGKFTGEFAASLPLVAGLGPVAGGAVAGALSTESDTPLGVAEDAALGAIGGKVGDLAVRGAARVIAPAIRKSAQTLSDEGIPLTIGQRLGGTAKSIEDRLAGFPGIGNDINARRAEGVAGLNKAVANRILGKIGKSLPDEIGPGHELADYVGTTLGNRYDAILSRMTGKLDGGFLNDVDGIKAAARNSTLPDAQWDRLNKIIKTQILDKAYQAGGELDGETAKGIQAELGRMTSGLKADSSFDQRSLGDYIGQLKTAVDDMLARSNPDLAPELRKTNAAYADYVKLRAAQKGVTGDKGFTPKQLQTAIRQTDKSVGKGNFARGKSSMQDLADAASDVLPNGIPDSGTAGREAIMNPWAWPGLLASSGAGKILYSPRGQAVLNALFAHDTKPSINAIAELVRQGRLPAATANALVAPAMLSPQIDQ